MHASSIFSLLRMIMLYLGLSSNERVEVAKKIKVLLLIIITVRLSSLDWSQLPPSQLSNNRGSTVTYS